MFMSAAQYKQFRQKDFQSEVEEHGARYILAYSVDDVEELVV